MSIFSRRKAAADSAAADGPVDEAQEPTPTRGVDHGPWDISEVDGVGSRFDLGAIAVAPMPHVELRVEFDEPSQKFTGVTLALPESTLQIQAFAAPRSEGVWGEIREEIAGNLSAAGAQVEQVAGPFGTELLTRMPASAPDGRTVFTPLCFVGVDGPRWFVRAVLAGTACTDPAAREPFEQTLRDLVVRRGDSPMAPREVLELTLPQQASDADGEASGAEGARESPAAGASPEQPAAPAQRVSDLNPFERGPEITEVR